MSQNYTGEVRGGVVVFEAGSLPAEGTRVRVEPISEGEQPRTGPEKDRVAGTRSMLLDWARKAERIAPDFPPDLAENHDHHAHGKPRE